MGVGFPFEEMKMFWNQIVVMLQNSMNILTTELFTLKTSHVNYNSAKEGVITLIMEVPIIIQ